MRLILLIFTVAMALACSGGTNNAKPNASVNSTPAVKSGTVPIYGYEVVNSYPHDPKAFTEGLFYHDGFLYESTGEEGRSSLRKIELTTGKIVQKWDNPREDFGEGIAMIGDKIYQLTWQQELGRVFDAKTFSVQKEFSYTGEGWGMTTDGTHLIFDQGTHVLKFVDAETLKTVKTVPVMQENGKPLMQLNELEMIKGELWANVWHSEQPDILGKPNLIARIDPNAGKVLGWIDLAGISPDDQGHKDQEENTLNGIAYDVEKDRIFVTGKQWKKLYEIRLTGPKNQ
jgi:glutaminyl-peptide cyclotransferase